MRNEEYDPLQPHSHEPNLDVPPGDGRFVLEMADGRCYTITLDDLRALPAVTLRECFIVSTGHGASGPFVFEGTALLDLVTRYAPDGWSQVEVVSEDGFGNRVLWSELVEPGQEGPILLAYARDERPLTRAQGLVRMIVPNERDDALRQVKWISRIRIRA